MSSLFNVSIPNPTLPGQHLYPKLATAKLEDPMLQPMVEKKGCEKVLGDMRDCLVEKNCWDKCDDEMQRFQQCINTKYFEEDEKHSVEILDEEDKSDLTNDLKEEEVDHEILDEEDKTDLSKEEEANLKEDIITSEKEVVIHEENVIAELDIKDHLAEGNEVQNEESDDGQENIDKDSFRVKIVPKSEDIKSDGSLLFNVTIKDTGSST